MEIPSATLHQPSAKTGVPLSEREEGDIDSLLEVAEEIEGTPPFLYSKETRVELAFVLTGLIGHLPKAHLSASNSIYPALSSKAEKEIKERGGITKAPSKPDVIAIRPGRWNPATGRSAPTRYTKGTVAQRARKLCGEMGIEAEQVAEAVAEAVTSGDVQQLHDKIHLGTKGCASAPSDTPQNLRLQRSDRENELDGLAVPIKRKGTSGQREMLDRMLAGRPHEQAERVMFLDLIGEALTARYAAGENEDEGWVPVGWKKIQTRYMGLSETTRRQATEKVWRDSQLIEAYRDGWYNPANDHDGAPKSREFRIRPDVFDAFVEAGVGEEKRYWLQTPTPQRTHQQSAMQTVLTDEHSNSYPELVDEALRILSDAEHLIDLDAIEKAETALAKKTGRSSRLKLRQLQLSKDVILRQAEERVGLSRIQNAYEVQPLSGRIGFREGGPQGMLAAVKARAYAHYANYDIASCHTSALREVVDMLAEVGVDIDMSPLESYLAKGGKDWAAREYSLPRTLVKICEHAVKYGAVIPRSIDQADNAKVYPNGRPELADAAEKYAEDPDEALQKLNEIFGEIREMVIEIAEALIGSYYDAKKKRGSWKMYNACGIGIKPDTYEEGHKRRSKVMAWALQGLEAAFVHSITILSEEYEEYTVVANEHDGAIVDGRVPEEAIERAREISGFTRADFVEKPFADEDEIESIYGEQSGPQEAESGVEAQTTADHIAAQTTSRRSPSATGAASGDGSSSPRRGGGDPSSPRRARHRRRRSESPEADLQPAETGPSG